MKMERNQSTTTKTSGTGTVVTAFVTGAVAGLAVGALLTSKKSSGLKDKLKNMIADFTSRGVASAVSRGTKSAEEEVRPAGYVQDTDNDGQDATDRNNYRPDSGDQTNSYPNT